MDERPPSGKETIMSAKISVELGHIQKTLFLPLWGRAVESKKPHPLLVDNTAVKILESVDYDFSGFAANIHPLTQLTWIKRSACVDGVVKDFLEKYPTGVIVNIGCGLDTTFDRIDNGRLTWYDLDLPDVIALRKNFITESERRRFISSSFLEEAWLQNIAAEENVLFIAAGVFYYFEEHEVKSFLVRLADRVPGCEILFDVSSPYGVRISNKMVIAKSGLDERSYLKWGLQNVGTILSWDERFQLVKTQFYFKSRVGSFRLKLAGTVADLLRVQYMIHLKTTGTKHLH
jgi:O-methyltransferase involved in polyketide biosynthesis